MTRSKGAEIKRIKILIVDDHPVVREGLALRIGQQPDLAVCGEAADVAEALRLVAGNPPDVAVVDISLKTGSGLDLIKRLKAHDNSIRILVWSMYGENLYAERAFRAGALGYITKEQATDQIIEAIRRVAEGKFYLSEFLADRVLKRSLGQGHTLPEGPSVDKLSDRELEVFQFMGHGLTTEQIAEKMRVSPKTVETYRARIKDKLGVDNFTELIQQATQWVLENH